MDNGSIIESGTPTEMFEAPQSDRLKRFLSQILHH
jgi:ABC-type histidine transport system ATPase subunit